MKKKKGWEEWSEPFTGKENGKQDGKGFVRGD